VTIFAAHGFIIPGLSDVAKETMFKLQFGISAAQSAMLVVYERIRPVLGYMMVGLLTTIRTPFLQVPLLLVLVSLALWVAGFIFLGFILVFSNRHILKRYPIFNVLISALVASINFIISAAVSMSCLFVRWSSYCSYQRLSCSFPVRWRYQLSRC
jgi:hypothetical protein